MNEKWIERYFALARLVATWSKDPSTKVGAVIVGKNRKQIAVGYNGFPVGIEDTAERLEDRPTKYRLIQHAERNVLDNAAFDLEGATLVTTQFPCDECAKSIVSKKIKRVVAPPMPSREPWREASLWAQRILEEAGVEIVVVCE
jgi:dCMP deaminase